MYGVALDFYTCEHPEIILPRQASGDFGNTIIFADHQLARSRNLGVVILK